MRAPLLLLLLVVVTLASSQTTCPEAEQVLRCEEAQDPTSLTYLLFGGYSGAQSCATALPDPTLCVSSTQSLYEFDFFLQLDLSETGSCTLQLDLDSVPTDQSLNCNTTFCNGTQSTRCGYVSLSGLQVDILVTNLRYVKTMQPIGSFSYDTLEITQLAQYTDLGNPAGSESAFMCGSVCANTTCAFRAADVNGSYCYTGMVNDFASGFGPSEFNCVEVGQVVFVPGTPDFTSSCCGDCETCTCVNTTYVPYYPQSSPVSAYQLFSLSNGAGFQLDASTGGLPNNTYNEDNPMFVSSRGWPFSPLDTDLAYYQLLTACPPTNPNCTYGNGLWQAALRRDPLNPLRVLPGDIDGKLACGYCSQGPPGFLACGDPLIPALIAEQTYLMNMSPTCWAMQPVDEPILRADVVISVTGLAGQTTTESFLNLELDGQQELVMAGMGGTIFLVIEPNLQQSPLDDPQVTNAVIVVCAPDLTGEDFTPLNPINWSGSVSPWADRTGPASQLTNCYGCLPDEQATGQGSTRLWWYMTEDQASAIFQFSNVGAAQRAGIANRMVQFNDCDNPVGNTTGCAPGTYPDVQSATCAAGGMNTLIPPVTAADVGRAFAAYRALLTVATTKAIDPFTTPAGEFLPPFWNYMRPNVWLESTEEAMSLVYMPTSSPFEGTVLQEVDITIYVDTTLASLPQPIPPLVLVPSDSDLFLCPLSNVYTPREGTGSLDIVINPMYLPSTPVPYGLQASVGGTLPCLLNGVEFLQIFIQGQTLTVEVLCNATSLPAALDPSLLFVLTATHGSIVSFDFEIVICPSLVIAAMQVNAAPVPPLDPSVTLLNPPNNTITIGQNYGPGSLNEYVDNAYQTERIAIIFWSAAIVVFPGILFLFSFGWFLYLVISRESAINKFVKS